jgi:formamidopyrimidine-DNA glycosylase
MPELPDVEVFRRRTARSSLHLPIARVRALDPAVLEDTGDRALTRALRGSTFEATRRHGKHLFVDVSGGSVLVMHFGMTGHPEAGDVAEEKHVRLLIEFEDGTALSLVDQRREARVTLAGSVDEYVAARGLGRDAMSFDADELSDLVHASRAEVKVALTDQERIAGLGNVYADEILFQARIDPRAPARVVDDPTCKKLHRQLHQVVDLAVKRRADPARMPKTWLLPNRQNGAPCPRGKGTVRQFRWQGRIGYWCPSCQAGDRPDEHCRAGT